MKRLCKISIAVHCFLAAVFDIFFIIYTDKLETLHDDNDLCIIKIWEVQNRRNILNHPVMQTPHFGLSIMHMPMDFQGMM